MDAKRFDRLSKTIASRSTRRAALTRLGLGGLAGAAAGGGLARDVFAANGDQACLLQFHAKTAVGSHKNKIYEGQLTLVIGADGAIDSGSFDDGSGDQPTVAGESSGRAVSFRIEYANGDNFIFDGTAAQDLALCRGRIDGTFNGPAESDLGTWRATAGSQPESSGASIGNGSSESSPTAATGADGGACPFELQLCDGSTPCCEAFAPYEATKVSCVGGTCRCMYSCAQAGCASTNTSIFMTVACDQNPNDLCATMGCNA
jgi:hypothetical protein